MAGEQQVGYIIDVVIIDVLNARDQMVHKEAKVASHFTKSVNSESAVAGHARHWFGIFRWDCVCCGTSRSSLIFCCRSKIACASLSRSVSMWLTALRSVQR